MQVQKISAVTLRVKDMDASFRFYSQIPGFTLAHGGPSEHFTSFQVGSARLNLELAKSVTD